MTPRQKTKHIIIHCSATPASHDIGLQEIRSWHVEDNGWQDVGYHYIIRRDGHIEAGRPDFVVGAHAKGHNQTSVGVCLVGGVNEYYDDDCNYTQAQYASLELLLVGLKEKYPAAKVIGHRDLPFVSKGCPCFDVRAWLKV